MSPSSARKRKHKKEEGSASEDERKKKKHKKEKKHKDKKVKRKKEKKKRKKSDSGPETSNKAEQGETSRRMCPMTKEEWDKRQSVVRRVHDEETGRSRLIKGDGEVLEEIVSKDRHLEINRKATRGDGLSFQSKLGIVPK